jgi:Family of unknown function (DUF6454)
MLILAASTCACSQTLADLELLQTLELRGRVYHVQGIDLDDGRLWVTSVDSASRKGYLHEFALPSGELKRAIEIQDGVRFHPGGISADAASIFIPVAEYRRDSSAVIQRRNKATLALEYQFEVADHIGCVAVGSDVLVGGNWDSRDLYIWDHRGKLQRKIPNPTGNGFQDIKLQNGILIGSGLLPGRKGAIDWLEFPSLRPLRRITAGNTDRGEPYTREGMAIRDGRLYLVPEDGPSRLFVFRLD